MVRSPAKTALRKSMVTCLFRNTALKPPSSMMFTYFPIVEKVLVVNGIDLKAVSIQQGRGIRLSKDSDFSSKGEKCQGVFY